MTARGASIVGASGATLSTTIEPVATGLALPAGSVCVAERAIVPVASGPLVIDQVPSTATTAVPRDTIAVEPFASWSPNSVTVAPGSPVPVMTGVVPPVGRSVLIDGASGAVVSMSTVSKSLPLTLPAASTCRASIV